MTVERRAVITGVSGAIGAQLARACAAAGFRVHAVYRDAARSVGLGAAHVADLGEEHEVEALCRELVAALPQLELLIHAAGAFEPGTIADVPPEQLDRMFRVNVKAPYVLTRALLPALRAGGGDVVFINSSAGADGGGPPRSAAYAATKHALRALADAIRGEENERGVRVLSVFPGRTAGPLQERLHGLERRPYEPERLLQPEDVARAVLAAVMLPRTAEVTDLHIRPRVKPRR